LYTLAGPMQQAEVGWRQGIAKAFWLEVTQCRRNREFLVTMFRADPSKLFFVTFVSRVRLKSIFF
jgi:hypothetical protein